MGLDPATLAIIASAATSAGAGIYNATSNNSTNSSNLNAQLQHQNTVQQYVNGLMQPGVNPFSQAIMQFIGRGVPGSFNGFSGIPLGGQGLPYAGAGTGSGPASPTGPNNPNPPNPNPGGNDGATYQSAPMSSTSMLAQLAQLAPAAQQAPAYQDWLDQLDPSLTQGMSRQDLIDTYQSSFGTATGAGTGQPVPNVPVATAQGAAQQNSTTTPAKQWSLSDPRTQAQILQEDYNGDYNAFLSGSPNPSVAALGAALQSGNQAAISQAAAALQNPANQTTGSPIGSGGVFGVGGNGQPIPGSTERYLQNGVFYDGQGQVLGYSDGSGTPDANGIFPQPPTPTYGGTTGVGGSQTADMWRYQSPGAYTVNPSLLGAAPQVTAPQISAQQIGALPQVQAGQVQASQISGLPQISAPTIAAPTGTQGFNAGQDGLMQLMNKQLSPTQDPSLSLNLQSLGTNGNPFDNSDLFKALGVQDQASMDQQVGALRASAGSLGQRFGTAMGSNEALLRSQLTNANATRNAQIAQSSFENAQTRRLQALGLASTNDQNLNQFTLQNAGLNLGAAQSLASNGVQGAGLDLQAGLANASNSLTAQQANLGANLQAQQLNQAAGLNASGQNAQLGLQGQQSNLQAFLQAQLANQSSGLTASQTNAQTGLQAGLANQNTLAQFMTNNANIMNQTNQFNAGQRTAENQFNAGQQQTYNSQILQALMSAANIQQSQTGQNIGLAGILNSVGVPQAMPNQLPGALGDASNSAMLMPFLLQMLGGKSGNTFNPTQYTNPSAFGGGIY